MVTPAAQPPYTAGQLFVAVHTRGVADVSQTEPVPLQFAHVAPSDPQIDFVIPGAQVLPWQQPAQLPGPHLMTHA